MKRVFFAIALLVVVLSVSYIKAVRGRSQQIATYQKARNDLKGSLTKSLKDTDSLRQVIERHDGEFGDSVAYLNLQHAAEIDSLEETTRILQDSLELERSKKVKPKTESAKSKTAKKKSTQSLDDKIISYYKTKYQALPKDLSKYELRVALAEIRTETADKFKISLAELGRIRTRSNLKY